MHSSPKYSKPQTSFLCQVRNTKKGTTSTLSENVPGDIHQPLSRAAQVAVLVGQRWERPGAPRLPSAQRL
eukprot:3572127-Amphidinium_carterae.1